MPTLPATRPDPLRVFFRWLLAVFFILAGGNHFRQPAAYEAMIPPWLHHPGALNVISGIAEILGGIGLMIPVLRAAAGWGLIVLLVAIFPANLHAALIGYMPGFSVSRTVLWLRLPFQLVFMAWVAWVSFPSKRERRRP